MVRWRCWAEAPIKIARMTLTIKLDGNWNSFQLANSAPPLCVTDSAIAPSARMIDMSANRSLQHQYTRAVVLSFWIIKVLGGNLPFAWNMTLAT
jgi:hypothetical protein